MSDRWRVKFHVWPYFSVKREPAHYTKDSEPNRGAKNPIVELSAPSFSDAVKSARDVLIGIRLDERVHAADIVAIEKI